MPLPLSAVEKKKFPEKKNPPSNSFAFTTYLVLAVSVATGGTTSHFCGCLVDFEVDVVEVKVQRSEGRRRGEEEASVCSKGPVSSGDRLE